MEVVLVLQDVEGGGFGRSWLAWTYWAWSL